jgi:Carbohydrate esterase, sialic acid-specific acetylesterase
MLFCSACNHNPIAATTPIVKAPIGLPIVVNGQSNAVNLFFADAMPAQYPSAVCGGCLANMPLSAWAPGSDLWIQLAATLHQKLTAFVHWEGEADGFMGNHNYANDERVFLSRVRSDNADPRLLVVIVQVITYADNQFIRQAQADVAASDPYVILVSMDGIPTDGVNHLVWLPGLANGYVAGAARIISAIASRQ